MSSIIQVKMEELNALPATKIVENEGVQAKFIQMYNAIWGTDKGEQMYHTEVFNFQKLLRDNPDVATSSKMSLYGCFLDIAVNGLTLDQTALLYSESQLQNWVQKRTWERYLRKTCIRFSYRLR